MEGECRHTARSFAITDCLDTTVGRNRCAAFEKPGRIDEEHKVMIWSAITRPLLWLVCVLRDCLCMFCVEMLS